MTKETAILGLHDVEYQWAGRAPFSLNVKHFTLEAGETVLLLGESGSGKSTLLSLICGTILAQSGRVEIAGRDLSVLSASRRDRYRAEKIGVIFQQFNLLPFANVLDNVGLALRFAPHRKARVDNLSQETQRLCTALGLPDGTLQKRAGSLSVGQQQRVAAARALIGQPPLIVADEPTSSLDAAAQDAFLDLLFKQSRANKAALLMVSHDPRLAQHFDRVVQMSDIASVERSA